MLNKGSIWKPRTGDKLAIKNEIAPFLQPYLTLRQLQPMKMDHDQQPINYLAKSIFANVKTNVQEHYMQMLLRFINLRIGVKSKKKELSGRKEELKQFFARVRWLKRFFLLEAKPTNAEWVSLTPIERNLFDEIFDILPILPSSDPLAYLVVSDPIYFLPSYCRLSRRYEYHGFPQFTALPLRTTLVQSHVQIDTMILYRHVLGLKRKDAEGYQEDMKDELWGRVFRLEKKAFQPRAGMRFDGTVCTDGHSLTVCISHPDAKRGQKAGRKSKATLQAEVREQYVENKIDRLQLAENVVVGDPNKRDLIYFQDTLTEFTFRYTSNQRAVETGSREFRKKRERLKQQGGIDKLESNIPTHKTMDLQGYCRYLATVAATEAQRQHFYDREIHRRMTFNSYRNTQRTETKLLANMKKRYGKNIVVVMGDWSDAGRTAKFQTSSKTKGWRTLFRRNGIPCFLIDEFRTSSYCPLCEEKIEGKLWKRPSSRPWRRKEGHQEDVHGLLGKLIGRFAR
ncbi:hypothetical protein HDV00_003153 [Rhizophlyctis rosea]|nr:hypothetical protein HDV00_003153 [Rhizophlyctis rosea]